MPKFRQIAHGVVNAIQITEETASSIETYNPDTGQMELVEGEIGDWIVSQGTQLQIVKDKEFRALYHPVDKVIAPIPPTDLNDGDDNPQPWTEWNTEE
ncbi:hypothetical protein J5I95_22660 [Candidatus Poribacteria bacterium]|nr:hypothetical protein [Candidatus Poribacteria bacterium]